MTLWAVEKPSVGVLGMATYLPRRIRTNAEVAETADVPADWIRERTGVRQRHVAEPDQAASDLAARAVAGACGAAGIGVGDLGLLILATSTPDELGPATACRVQQLVGAGAATALDVGAACSGWLFGAKVADAWLRTTPDVRYAAVVGVEAYSKFVDPRDRGTAVLFGDGAAAAVLGPVPAGRGFGAFRLGSDGAGAGTVLIPGGGSRRPASAGTVAEGAHHIHMDGRAVRDFIVETFPRLVKDTLHDAGLELGDLDAVVVHQPNPVLLARLGAEAGIPADRLPIVGDRVGNIGSASAPFALAEAARRGLLRSGSRVLICVFGAGLTWGSVLLSWDGAAAVMR